MHAIFCACLVPVFYAGSASNCGSAFPVRDFHVNALPDDSRDRFFESALIVVLALVEPERLLVEVAERMERLDIHIGSLETAFEQAPEILQSVGVDMTLCVGNGVIDNATRRPQGGYAYCKS
jgi:hypothetical protein